MNREPPPFRTGLTNESDHVRRVNRIRWDFVLDVENRECSTLFERCCVVAEFVEGKSECSNVRLLVHRAPQERIHCFRGSVLKSRVTIKVNFERSNFLDGGGGFGFAIVAG